MSLTTTARNQALDAIVIDAISLHDGFPGSTGANELTGSGYARLSCTFNASSAGIRNLSAPANFTVGVGHTVRWVGVWGGGVFKALSANAGSPREFQIDTAADEVLVPGNGYSNGDFVVFYGGTIPSPLIEGFLYYVVNAATDTFQISETLAGPAIDLLSSGAPDCIVTRLVANPYFAPGTHTVNTYSIGAVF